MVCLYLPRHYGTDEFDEAQTEGAEFAPTHAGGTVLVVDDEPAVRMLMMEVLADLGYQAIEAEDGPRGLNHLAGRHRIDLLITDVGLPGGLNGRQLADAALAHRPELKVLFITGYAENAAIGNGHLKPGMQVLTKPFSIDELSARIRSILAA